MRPVARLVGEGSDDGCSKQLTVSTNGDVFVADDGNDRIENSNSGRELPQRSTIKHDSMKCSFDVKLITNEVFVLTDLGSPIAREKIRLFITRGKGMQLTHHCCFCLDAEKNLIISVMRIKVSKSFANHKTDFRMGKHIIQLGVWGTL